MLNDELKRKILTRSGLVRFIELIVAEIKKHRNEIKKLSNEIDELKSHAILDSDWTNDEEGG